MRKPPPQRSKVLKFCVDEVAAGRPFPSAGQISQFMGWRQPASARDALSALAFYDKALGCTVVDGQRQFNLLPT